MSKPIYNTIGIGYNNTRKADPYIIERMMANLQPRPDGRYLDVGCGTGNYLKAFVDLGYDFTGIEPSEKMREMAENQCAGVPILDAKAENMPFDDAYFDGATAMFTFHHWTNQMSGLQELARVVKPGGKVVFLSFTWEQMEGYWLNHYFPEMMIASGKIVPEKTEMIRWLLEAGFKSVATENYFVQEDLQDQFLYANKFRPEAYLDTQIRMGASSFSAFSTPDEVESGLRLLEEDIVSGNIQDIMEAYENDNGDYLFYIAEK